MDKADGEMVVIMMSDHIVTTSAFITLIQKGYESIMEQSASLSHIVHFHEVENIDPLGWFLYESTCDKQASARYIIDARIYDQRGRCILSSVQEGLVQKKAK
ncbi:hypothetical protein L596_016371 [Steinernema carpocapsae]|uniref:Acyl-CoA thioesterase-like C-terminal domain-containing protein n=1 Tax=Steinernema carpocapsae TaxID=34508 RepID=A0A4U5NIU5_STECR|nr:hypothetical protein L596_016371 [Steinernema carpocapsae]